MRKAFAFLPAFLLALSPLAAAPAAAQAREIVTVEEWTEDGADRVVAGAPVALPQGTADYGPFRVLDSRHAALVDATDGRSPRQFAAMLKDHPGITTLEMIECPGTDDDTANLALGRLIRRAGLATHVPPRGSVRSGAVELFLAGKTRQVDDGAEFAVHSWRDSDGHEAGDYAADSPWNRAYIDYYVEMGMSRSQARAFYDMTNAVPNSAARWLTAQDMRGWLPAAPPAGTVTVRATPAAAAPEIAYLDSAARFP